jgi:hypothetical protein
LVAPPILLVNKLVPGQVDGSAPIKSNAVYYRVESASLATGHVIRVEPLDPSLVVHVYGSVGVAPKQVTLQLFPNTIRNLTDFHQIKYNQSQNLFVVSILFFSFLKKLVDFVHLDFLFLQTYTFISIIFTLNQLISFLK